MKNTKFYVCEKCGNILTSAGNAEIVCCGRKLSPLVAKEADEAHKLNIEKIEDDFYITFSHPMTKEHYISFLAALSTDKIQMVKLYPEGNAEARFKIRGVKRILFYCNRDGLFYINPIKGIDDKECSYDDTQERRELEQAAKVLFG